MLCMFRFKKPPAMLVGIYFYFIAICKIAFLVLLRINFSIRANPIREKYVVAIARKGNSLKN
jgi:hypothetical protein